ncbi:hypothetical protein [Caballeronia sp. ATUFL_M2_KS44]|uniref:hypothetical protein n=1 Tax=Caballeronia sp. ATUFL_M2_KS44 TaxID=2921767 RepID=UPI002028C210|nr:hypothetical protein [Caballeronia sp. ATUFL_M2_KS44]
MTHNLETRRQRLRETLLSGADTALLRAEIDGLEMAQERSKAQVERCNAERAAIVDEAMAREACARAEASVNRLKNLIRRLEPEG